LHHAAHRMALCGILCGLAEVLLLTSGLIPVAIYCGPLLAMFVLLPVREEYGSRASLTAWLAVGLLGIFLVPDKELAGVFLFFGWYPAAQPYLDRLPARPLRILCKLAVCGAAMAALYLLLIFVFQLNAVVEELIQSSPAMLAAMAALGAVTILATDEALRRIGFLWRFKLRRRFFRD
jgi:hypothetical protein